jgi:hypothetical protein
MFWYNRALSPAEYPLKPGQWKKVEKAVASRLKAMKKGKKLRRRKNDLPEIPAFKHSTPLIMAVRFGRLDVLRALLHFRCDATGRCQMISLSSPKFFI